MIKMTKISEKERKLKQLKDGECFITIEANEEWASIYGFKNTKLGDVFTLTTVEAPYNNNYFFKLIKVK